MKGIKSSGKKPNANVDETLHAGPLLCWRGTTDDLQAGGGGVFLMPEVDETNGHWVTDKTSKTQATGIRNGWESYAVRCLSLWLVCFESIPFRMMFRW